MKTVHEKSCGVIVFHNSASVKAGRYLLLHYPGGHWDLPKGHVEKNETEHETALRELKEETGITDAKILPSFRESIHYNYRRKTEICSKDVIFFLARAKTTHVKLSFEHKNFIWLPYSSALKKLTFQNAKNILIKAERYLTASHFTIR